MACGLFPEPWLFSVVIQLADVVTSKLQLPGEEICTPECGAIVEAESAPGLNWKPQSVPL
jgi:hypothetical protein